MLTLILPKALRGWAKFFLPALVTVIGVFIRAGIQGTLDRPGLAAALTGLGVAFYAACQANLPAGTLLDRAAKSVLPALGVVLAVVMSWIATGVWNAQEFAIAITGLVAVLLVYVPPNIPAVRPVAKVAR